MSVWLQYHNHYKKVSEDACPQLLPCSRDRELFEERPCGIYTGKKVVNEAIGDRILLITGVGKPRSFFLWSSFVLENVKEDSAGFFNASGPG